MGLPRDDGRRIVPVTSPLEAKVEPDWEEGLAVMLKKQPEIVRMNRLVKEAESDVSPDGLIRLERAKSYQKQVIHQATHSLARFFLGIDANHKQFSTASRLRAAAALRLESQRAYYEEGRITVDRFFDAVTQYASAVVAEAQCKTSYNHSIVALEEAKGTLLEHDGITVVDGPKSGLSIAGARDHAVKGAWYEPSVLTERTARDAQAPIPSAPGEPQAKAASPSTDTGVKTFSFQFTIGTGSKPIEIRGSFTITPAQTADPPSIR
jgi:Outer membrane efflux protein